MDNNEIKEEKAENSSITTLATDLLGEVKTQTKRWMIAFFIVLACWVATIAGFIWYLNQYDYSSYEVNSQDGGNANFVGNDGDITNGFGKSQNAEE